MQFPPPLPPSLPSPPAAQATEQGEPLAVTTPSGELGETSPTHARGTLVGATGVGSSLQTDKTLCASDEDILSIARSSVSEDVTSLDSFEQPRSLSTDSSIPLRSSLSGSRESRADRLSMPGSTKKSVSFNEVKSVKILPKLDPKEWQPFPGGELDGASSHDEEQSRWAQEERGFARMRAFSRSIRRWKDILQPEGGKANKSGLKRMAALTKQVYESPPVKRAIEIFSDARCLSDSKQSNALSGVILPQGMLFSRSDLKALDAARMALVDLLGDTATKLDDLAWRASVIQRTTSMDKLDGKVIPHHGVVLPLAVTANLTDDPKSFPLSWSFSLGGDVVSVTRPQLNILFWAEFLSGMRGSSPDQSEGFQMPLVNGKLQVVVINDAA